MFRLTLDVYGIQFAVHSRSLMIESTSKLSVRLRWGVYIK